MTILRNTFAAACIGAALTALPAMSGSAQAMSLPGAQPALMDAAGPAAPIDQVRWVCGPYRCHWAPNYYYGYGRPYWGPRPFYGYGGGRGYGYGYGHRWRRW